MGKHFTTDIKETGFTFKRNQKKIDEEAALDGIYIIRTSLAEATMSAEETVFAYKNLSMVEQAFRYLKQLDLNIRPIRHRLDDRINPMSFYACWHSMWNGICVKDYRTCCLKMNIVRRWKIRENLL